MSPFQENFGNTIDQLSRLQPAEMKSYYSTGIILYHQHDTNSHKRIRDALRGAFSDRYIHVTSDIIGFYPNDCGYQIGNRLHTDGKATSYLLSTLWPEPSNTELSQFFSIVPQQCLPRIEGGLTVPVGGSDFIAYVDSSGVFEKAGGFPRGGDIQMISPIEIAGIDDVFSYSAASCPIEVKWLYQLENGYHIDLTLTGFHPTKSKSSKDKIIWYADSVLLDTLGKKGKNIYPYSQAKRFPTELTVKGGLNLLYIKHKDKWTVVVPSREVINPMVSDLEKCGFEIVELGEDQVENKAGIKCRSLIVNWLD